MELKSCNPFAEEVTVKSSREVYCRKMGLVGLKVNESVGKKAGIAGQVKMWAKDRATLTKALSTLEQAQMGGGRGSIDSSRGMHRVDNRRAAAAVDRGAGAASTSRLPYSASDPRASCL